MVESLFCQACSSPVLPGHSFCAACGARLSGVTAPSADAAGFVDSGAAASPEAGDANDVAAIAFASTAAAAIPEDATFETDPRLMALGIVPDPPAQPDFPAEAALPEAPAPEPPPFVPPEPPPFVAPESPTFAAPAPPLDLAPAPPPFAAPAPPSDVAPAASPLPADDQSARIPGGYLPPAAGPVPSAWTMQPSNADPRQAGRSLSVSVGAIPVTPAGMNPPTVETFAAPAPPNLFSVEAAGAATPTAEPAPLQGPLPGQLPGPMPGAQFAAPAYPAPFAVNSSAPYPGMPVAATPQAPDRPVHKESTQALVAFGLIAAGSLIGMASLFLPWTAANGIGVGTTGATPPPSQWGWGMPAAIPLFLLGVLVLGAVSSRERVQERLPILAKILGRVTDLIMPMILGGLYLGVFLLYATLPWGYGSGVFGLLAGAGLLIAGALVTLFSPEVDGPRV